jgi:hypothetical protein
MIEQKLKAKMNLILGKKDKYTAPKLYEKDLSYSQKILYVINNSTTRQSPLQIALEIAKLDGIDREAPKFNTIRKSIDNTIRLLFLENLIVRHNGINSKYVYQRKSKTN